MKENHENPLACLNRVDLCFVIDTTGSMAAFLNQAKLHLLNTLRRLQEQHGLDLAVGLVEYRDHPPQERSFVTRCYALTTNLELIRRDIQRLKADGGGDHPEAVFDGVYAACKEIQWRQYSRRIILLVGDAPPQGTRPGQPNGVVCHASCGLDLFRTASGVEQVSAVLYAIPLTRDRMTQEAFAGLAKQTGGVAVETGQAANVIEKIADALSEEFGYLVFDLAVLQTAFDFSDVDTQAIADALGETRGKVASAIARLGQRGLLDALLPKPVPFALT